MELTVKEFEHFYRCLYRPLGMYALRYTENIDDAEDIVQETFANVWDKISSGEVISDFKSYMYRAVKNRALSFLQSSPYELSEEIQNDNSDEVEEEQIYIAERDARLWTAIDKLPAQRRKIFLLAKRDGLTYAEIAEELNLSIKTIEHQINKALKCLRDKAVKIYSFFFG